MFTARVQYALIFLFELREKGKFPVKLKETAEKHGMKLEFLEQVARKLRLKNYVKSIKGPGGGYILTKKLENINLLDVYKVMQPDSKLKLSPDGKEAKELIKEFYNEYIECIKDIKLL